MSEIQPKLNPRLVDADAKGIDLAARILTSGGLVAFPKETVYGLGALALDSHSVEEIFKAKGRPADNPLIVHISTDEMLRSVAVDIPDSAIRLMAAFWPGPLTLVLKKSPDVPDIVSAGLETVAVRLPNHAVARALIDAVGQPIAAPSANRSGRPSPTLATHVAQELGGSVDLILDGGPAQVGVESTVLDLTRPQPVLLRPGGVTRDDIEQALGATVALSTGEGIARSPGIKHRHYSPRCRLVLVLPSELKGILAQGGSSQEKRGLLCRSSDLPDLAQFSFVRQVKGDLSAYARDLFASLLEAEAAGVEVLYVEETDEEGLGLAIMDRLRRASAIK